MKEKYPLPTLPTVVKLLSTLLDEKLKAKECQPWIPNNYELFNIASYKTDDGSIATLCLTDFILGASLAARLGRLPSRILTEALEIQMYTETLVGNLHEIMNILSCLMNSDKSRHIAFDAFHPMLPKMPDTLATSLDTMRARIDLELTIPSYGTGIITFLSPVIES